MCCKRCCLLNFHYMRRTFQTVYMCSKMKKNSFSVPPPPQVSSAACHTKSFSRLMHLIHFVLWPTGQLLLLQWPDIRRIRHRVLLFPCLWPQTGNLFFFLCLLFSCCCATSTEFDAASCSWSAQDATSTAASNGNLHRGASVLLW